MSILSEHSAFEILGGLAMVMFLLLLVAPWFPPQAAIFITVALFVLASVLYLLLQHASQVTFKNLDRSDE